MYSGACVRKSTKINSRKIRLAKMETIIIGNDYLNAAKQNEVHQLFLVNQIFSPIWNFRNKFHENVNDRKAKLFTHQ